MANPIIAPFGTWKSPITADILAAQNIRLTSVRLDGEDVYWLEGRPGEGGRNVLVQRAGAGGTIDVTPPPFDVRSRVHEYGGAAFLVENGTVWFVNFEDQRVYQKTLGAEIEPLTPAGPFRYADMVLDQRRHRLICVREDHSRENVRPVNEIVSIDLSDGTVRTLVSGHDFVSNPRLSPNGSRLAWLTWNYSGMPWDATELWVASIHDDGCIGAALRIAGGESESVFQPEWAPSGELYYISDPTSWWNLYCWRDNAVKQVCAKKAEFGLPQWLLGMTTYGFHGRERLVCTYCEHGIWNLAYVDTRIGMLTAVRTNFTQFESLVVAGDRAAFIGRAPRRLPAVVCLHLATGREVVLRESSPRDYSADYVSIPDHIGFKTSHRETAYGFFYTPRNTQYRGPEGEKPPLLIRSHGGPTSAANATLDLEVQFWTSRGIAVFDVNYRGSSGYGRLYRDRLKQKWGIFDVEDCIEGARHLVETNKVDANLLAIRGVSAGGYTTLAALTFSKVFKAGASYYGISDLEAIARDTHKFESHYLDQLIGPLPKYRSEYRRRSPINFINQVSCPVIFFQGLEDKVVPPNQAKEMAVALRNKNMPVAHLAFDAEQHGFRRKENIKRSIEVELYFYGRVLGFEPADAIEPIRISNL